MALRMSTSYTAAPYLALTDLRPTCASLVSTASHHSGETISKSPDIKMHFSHYAGGSIVTPVLVARTPRTLAPWFLITSCRFVCKSVCKFAQRQPPPNRVGRTVLALQNRCCYASAPTGPTNRDANREPRANPRPKSPTVFEFSWGKNDYTFVRKWAIWRP